MERDKYGLLGLERDNTAGVHAQMGRNSFFDAPVALMFTMDCLLALGSWLDYGMRWVTPIPITSSTVNTLWTEREPVDNFMTFITDRDAP